MSIGNTRDEGNKGNNFPWQLKMLLGQQCACDQLEQVANFTAQTASNTDQVEFLLTAILTSLQEGTEYEAKFVKETCPGEPPTTRILLEVRVWDTDSSTWGPITYYLPGNDTPEPIGVGCTLEYTDPSGVLAMILAELQAQTVILTDIEADTTSIDVTLTNILSAYSAGQQACSSSLSVTLCTEQEQTLTDIEINTENTATNTSNALTELLDQGLTLDSLQTLITTLNGTVATEVTLAQVLTELQAINIDTNGLNQEATQLLVLAAINTVIANTTGLSTEVTLNALLTAFNAEDFATETTLNNFLTAFNAEDFATETTLAALNLWVQGNAATETTLQSVLLELQGINLDTNGLSQEATQLLVLAALNNIFADTTAIVTNTNNLDVPLSTVATEVTLQAVLTAINNISTSGLATEATLLALLNAFNAEDFATETTLALIEAITSQMTFTGGDLNVSANMQVGDVDVSAANPVPVVLPTGTETPYYVEYAGPTAITPTPTGAKSVSLFNEGPDRWQLSSDGGVTWINFNEGQIVEWTASEGKTLNAIAFRKVTAGGRLVMSYTI